MGKRLITAFMAFLSLFYCTADTLDFDAVIGFNNLYKRDIWTPLNIRLQNSGSSLSGELVIITDNSSIASEQIRIYRRPVDLPSGSEKVLSLSIPAGIINREIECYFESEGTILFDEIMDLKQKGVRENFILSVSPYPDLNIKSDHPVLQNRIIAYPHPDLLPESFSAYDSVDIISIRRELFEQLNNRQFEAIRSWASGGGVLIVWGGKSPVPFARDYLPGKIEGLTKGNVLTGLDKYTSVPMNRMAIPEGERIELPGIGITGAAKYSGRGLLLFVPFDYSVAHGEWNGFVDFWDFIARSATPDRSLESAMDEPLSLEEYIALFDQSGFSYPGRVNAALMLFLWVSLIVSLMIFLKLRIKKPRIHLYISGQLVLMILLPLAIGYMLFSDRFRNDAFVLDLNTIYQMGFSDSAFLYKDILVGSSGRTANSISFTDSTEGIILRKDRENLTLYYKPELEIRDIALASWSSRIFRMKDSVQSFCDAEFATDQKGSISLTVHNKSDYYLNETAILYKGMFYRFNPLMPGSAETKLLEGEISEKPFFRNSLFNVMTERLFPSLSATDGPVFIAAIKEDPENISFTLDSWKKNTWSLIITEARRRGIE